jgi:hypothetical protein
MSRALNEISIRFATLDNAGLLLRLIRDMAAYERTPNAVVATEEDLRRYGFGPNRQFEALLAFLDGEPVGFALFHPRCKRRSKNPSLKRPVGPVAPE